MPGSLRGIFWPEPPALSPSEARPLAGPVRLGFAVAVVVTATLWLAYRSAPSYLNQYDDAYITFRYALNWARGLGLVFNAGEPTDGASSPLHALLLAGAYKVGLTDLERLSFWLGVGAAGATAGLVTGFAAWRTGALLISVALGAAAGLHGFVSGWAVSGMETAVYGLLAAAVSVRLLTDRPGGLVTGALLAAALLTRFEAVLLVAGWAVLAGWRLRGAPRTERQAILVAGGLVVGAAAALAILRLLAYGAVVPQAFVLKRVLTYYQPQPRALASFWGAHAAAVVALGAGGLVRCWRTNVPVARAVTVFVGLAALSVLSGPYADGGRYSTYLLPIFLLLAAELLAAAWAAIPALAVVALALVGLQTKQSFDVMKAFNDAIADHQLCRKRIGAFIAAHAAAQAPRDALVLSSDIGAIAYAAPDVRFLDAAGLTSADVARALQAGDNLDGILARRRPTLVADTIVGPAPAPGQVRYAAFDYLQPPGRTHRPPPPSTVAPTMKASPPLASCTTASGVSFGVSTLSFDQ